MMLHHRFRHRVTIQKQQQVKNPESGATSIAWVTASLEDGTPMVDVPAEVLTGPGREFVAADVKQAQTTARINLRWFPVDRIELYRWRVLWDGRTFGITSADTDASARREWRLRCEDGVNDGR